MQTDRQRLDFLIHALADPDCDFDYTPAQVERMQREKAELETELERENTKGMT